jgi:DNA-binding XRE family transcriptional regulator
MQSGTFLTGDGLLFLCPLPFRNLSRLFSKVKDFLVVNYETYVNMTKEPRDFYEMSLEEIRDLRGYSRRTLALVLSGKVSEDSLYGIEKMKQVPRVDTALAICEALNISLKQFCHSIGLDVSAVPDDYLPKRIGEPLSTTDN